MSSLNDSKILELKEKILEKKAKLEKSKKFSPITNCSILLEKGKPAININTLNVETATQLLVQLNMQLMSAKDLGLEKTYKMSGFLVTEWMTDVKSKLGVLSKRDEEAKLKAMESTLDKLLSADKQTELQLEEMAKLLL